MSHTLVVEVSDEVYAAIQRQAAATKVSPADIVATSLEQQFRAEHAAVHDVLIRAGLSSARPASLIAVQPLTQQQRQELAQQVAHGRPLSEYIRDERSEH